MKKSLLLLLAATASLGATAQNLLNLSGSSYYQTFDNVGTGLPKGWEVDTGATATSIGNSYGFDTTPTAWNNTSGKATNFAAKDILSSSASASTQSAATNRAMGIRQVSKTNQGVAFTLSLSQTQGLKNFNVAFNLQSLDVASARTSTWEVQYGLGATPSTFTTVSSSSTAGMTTGGSSFTNSVVTASFGSALDSQSGPIVIRIVSLNATSGGGSRASTGIDSFTLSWTGTAVVYEPQLVSFTPANGATNIPTGISLSLRFDKAITAGAGKIYLKNVTDQSSISKLATSTDVAIAGTVATVSNLGLVLGKTYSVTFDTNAFMSGAYASAGLTDTNAWVFSTLNPVITVNDINEDFDSACAASHLPSGWSRQNVVGPGQQWNCYTPSGGSNAAMQMNGYQGGNNANEDWLITPKVNLGGTGKSNGRIVFRMQKSFTGTEPDVLISTNYDGNSLPASATWTSLAIPMTVADTGDFKTYTAMLGAVGLQPFFIGFKYTSTTTDGYRVRLDSVVVDYGMGVGAYSSNSNKMPLQVLSTQNGKVLISFTASAAEKMNTVIYDLVGRAVYQTNIPSKLGENKVELHPTSLPAGIYIIKVGNGREQGVARTFIQ